MKILKKLGALAVTGVLGLSLAACGGADNKTTSQSDSKAGETKNITVGVCPGPYGDMVKEVFTPLLEEKGYKVEVREFSDYIQPDQALNNGEIQANLMQHTEYLNKFAKDNNLQISAVKTVPTLGMGMFSNKYTSIDEIPDGAKIGVPNDGSNLARALNVLSVNNIIKLKDEVDPAKASKLDIAENTKNIELVEVEGAQLARSIESTDASLVPGNYAYASGLDYSKALAIEPLTENYKNVVAVKTEDLDKDLGKDFKEIIESDKFKEAIEGSKFKDFSKPEWWK
ncbi:MetQ/NlpA family ABC transporter substrate-binding protein [uncultured Clostridium sp.]|uniref:MetQ/NlpA family ABC transporter substrate-binding protein n=1 Tax=uncultured Clostridium sp. TaxID=59620 RepID=UPI0025F15F83|nr:MetQ/NlpA family ABC transporter substrate-binding protein [uncultured Clostridium sp.]